MHEILRDSHPILGSIPGPLAFAADGAVLWVAGGGRGSSAVLRFGAAGWQRLSVPAHGLRAILPLGDDRAIVVGESGYAAYVTVGPEGEPETIAVPTRECLFTVARATDGRILVGGDGGALYAIDGTRAEHLRTGTQHRVAHVLPDGDTWLWAGAGGLYRARANGYSTKVLDTPAALTRMAIAPDGTLALSGDAGQLWFVRGEEHTRIESSTTADLETIAWDPGGAHFVVGGAGGMLLTLGLDGTVRRLAIVDAERSVTALLPARGGILAGAWKQTGAPYTFVGLITFLGEDPPVAIQPPARQQLPPRRARSFAIADAPLGAADGKVITMEEAQRRLPDVAWPDTTQLEHVRFYAGDVRVASTDELLAETESRGFAVAIAGNLVVDGLLDAVAGGDGYDSVLVVTGNVFAEAAVFVYGIQCVIGGVLEVATVVGMSNGDDGGYVACARLAAQVLAYANYFSPPDAERDCFAIGDVYGERAFPPSRGAEVFVPEVLDEGFIDVRSLADALRAGKPVLAGDA